MPGFLGARAYTPHPDFLPGTYTVSVPLPAAAASVSFRKHFEGVSHAWPPAAWRSGPDSSTISRVGLGVLLLGYSFDSVFVLGENGFAVFYTKWKRVARLGYVFTYVWGSRMRRGSEVDDVVYLITNQL